MPANAGIQSLAKYLVTRFEDVKLSVRVAMVRHRRALTMTVQRY